MACCFIISTYWYTDKINSWEVFDHPFSIKEKGTLERTLISLKENQIENEIVLLPVPISEEIYRKVYDIAKKIPELNITIINVNQYNQITSCLKKTGMKWKSLKLIDTFCYGGVRNLGLVYAQLKGYDQVIMIDDDEVIDSSYLKKSQELIGSSSYGEKVFAKTGCVENENGKKLYEGQTHESLKSWPKDYLFNKQVQSMLSNKNNRLCLSDIGFGGNMILDNHVFKMVPFDPFGTRGEDDDYVLNCRYCGYKMFFDNELVIKHLPPKRNNMYWSRHRQDIIRFSYVKEKAKLFGIEKEDLGIFFNYFIGDDFKKKAVNSSIDAALYFEDIDRTEFIEFLNNAKEAVRENKKSIDEKIETFKEFIGIWQNSMKTLS